MAANDVPISTRIEALRRSTAIASATAISPAQRAGAAWAADVVELLAELNGRLEAAERLLAPKQA